MPGHDRLAAAVGAGAPEQTKANFDLVGPDAEAARQAGIRNQLVVVDPQSGETRAGSDGLLWIIADTPGHKLWTSILGLPVLRQLLRMGYETISYNRRVISPPRHQITCDCEPEVTVGRRLMLIVPLLLVSLVIAAAFGAAVFVGWNLGAASDGALVQMAISTGWLVLIVAGLLLLGGMRGLDYVAHLVVTMFAGALILVPAAVLAPLVPRPASVAIGVLSLMFCFSTMFKMQHRRVAALHLSWAWLWAWTLVMLASFAGVVAWRFGTQIVAAMH